jgi:toxin ParE1/3/4
MRLVPMLQPSAEADIREIHEALEEIRAGLGAHFAGRLREVLERIEAMPELYGIVWQDVRAARLRRFRYVVYYAVFEDRIEIIAVLHGSREQSTWQSRL